MGIVAFLQKVKSSKSTFTQQTVALRLLFLFNPHLLADYRQIDVSQAKNGFKHSQQMAKSPTIHSCFLVITWSSQNRGVMLD